MLTTSCIHPEIMAALSRCGHGSKILIADGNYPLDEKSGSARKVFLGLCRGTPSVMDVLRTLHGVAEFERAEVMEPAGGPEPEIFDAFRSELPGLALEKLGRQAFYDACTAPEAVFLAISTGEERAFSNILLTVACV